MNWKLPLDIPLITPTLGLPLWVFDILLIIVFVVHIVFIYTLIGSALATVIYNIIGVFKKSEEHDELAHRLTTFTTISENMGALWGVAPLLIIGVLYTAFFYTTLMKISPHILHIIYGNIIAFLCSYAYKFSWKHLKEHKGLHIIIGFAMLILFYSLPFIFISMVNLYVHPELFGSVKNIWDIMLTPLTGIRLLNFFLTAFSFFGAVLMFYGKKWSLEGGLTERVGFLAMEQGKKWIILSAPLNILILPLILFSFSPRISESFFKSPFVLLPFISAAILFGLVVKLVLSLKEKNISLRFSRGVMGAMLVAVLLMATARQGIRHVSFREPMEVQTAATASYMNGVLQAYQESKNLEKNKPTETDVDPRKKLAQDKGCFACHSVELRVVGPAYKSVAKKYSSVEEIIPSILKGSTGKWPEVNGATMPALGLTEEEARKIATWILEQK